jgi:hypothetical protein
LLNETIYEEEIMTEKHVTEKQRQKVSVPSKMVDQQISDSLPSNILLGDPIDLSGQLPKLASWITQERGIQTTVETPKSAEECATAALQEAWIRSGNDGGQLLWEGINLYQNKQAYFSTSVIYSLFGVKPIDTQNKHKQQIDRFLKFRGLNPLNDKRYHNALKQIFSDALNYAYAQKVQRFNPTTQTTENVTEEYAKENFIQFEELLTYLAVNTCQAAGKMFLDEFIGVSGVGLIAQNDSVHKNSMRIVVNKDGSLTFGFITHLKYLNNKGTELFGVQTIVEYSIKKNLSASQIQLSTTKLSAQFYVDSHQSAARQQANKYLSLTQSQLELFYDYSVGTALLNPAQVFTPIQLFSYAVLPTEYVQMKQSTNTDLKYISYMCAHALISSDNYKHWGVDQKILCITQIIEGEGFQVWDKNLREQFLSQLDPKIIENSRIQKALKKPTTSVDTSMDTTAQSSFYNLFDDKVWKAFGKTDPSRLLVIKRTIQELMESDPGFLPIDYLIYVGVDDPKDDLSQQISQRMLELWKTANTSSDKMNFINRLVGTNATEFLLLCSVYWKEFGLTEQQSVFLTALVDTDQFNVMKTVDNPAERKMAKDILEVLIPVSPGETTRAYPSALNRLEKMMKPIDQRRLGSSGCLKYPAPLKLVFRTSGSLPLPQNFYIEWDKSKSLPITRLFPHLKDRVSVDYVTSQASLSIAATKTDAFPSGATAVSVEKKSTTGAVEPFMSSPQSQTASEPLANNYFTVRGEGQLEKEFVDYLAKLIVENNADALKDPTLKREIKINTTAFGEQAKRLEQLYKEAFTAAFAAAGIKRDVNEAVSFKSKSLEEEAETPRPLSPSGFNVR